MKSLLSSFAHLYLYLELHQIQCLHHYYEPSVQDNSFLKQSSCLVDTNVLTCAEGMEPSESALFNASSMIACIKTLFSSTGPICCCCFSFPFLSSFWCALLSLCSCSFSWCTKDWGVFRTSERNLSTFLSTCLWCFDGTNLVVSKRIVYWTQHVFLFEGRYTLGKCIVEEKGFSKRELESGKVIAWHIGCENFDFLIHCQSRHNVYKKKRKFNIPCPTSAPACITEILVILNL